MYKQSMYDENLILKDAGLVAADAAGTVDSSAKIIDLGAALVEGRMFVDVSAIEIDSNDELYQISLQGGTSSTFATSGTDTFEDLVVLEIGAQEVLAGNVDSVTGRYAVPFSNRKDGNTYRYVREYCDVSGTIATGGGINFTAWLGK